MLAKVIRYTLSIFYLLIGVLALFVPALTSAVLFIMAALLMVPLAKAAAPKPAKFKGWVQVTLAVALAFGGLLAMPSKPKAEGTAPTVAARLADNSPSTVSDVTEQDIDWEPEMLPHKEMIVSTINRIKKEDARCAKVHPELAGYSKDRSAEWGSEVFFVHCGDLFDAKKSATVYFDAARAADPTPFAEPKRLDRGTQITLCENAAKASATHPSTVNVSTMMDVSYEDHPEGLTTLRTTFTAKNDFNLELKYNIRCELGPAGLLNTQISEAK